MEREIKDAIGFDSPQLQPESTPTPEPEPQPNVSIYDFGKLLAENEPPK